MRLNNDELWEKAGTATYFVQPEEVRNSEMDKR